MKAATRRRAMSPARRERDERGSAAIEAVFGVPAFGLFVGLIIFGGRTASTDEALQSAAAEGARSASIARDAQVARIQAREAAVASIANQEIGCEGVEVSVDTSDFGKPPGAPGSVEVTVSCRLALSDLSVPGVPGSRVMRASMSSPIDTWRETAP
ncbi:pilus assembly protein [Nocardioides hankookensis]|uniref:TadE/TadG family type IV pilus assembly protein n=1 Tax=Nocardioides hankookensis TaxID=443157 RepID=A0ABW1LNK5_9ACTN